MRGMNGEETKLFNGFLDILIATLLAEEKNKNEAQKKLKDTFFRKE